MGDLLVNFPTKEYLCFHVIVVCSLCVYIYMCVCHETHQCNILRFFTDCTIICNKTYL